MCRSTPGSRNDVAVATIDQRLNEFILATRTAVPMALQVPPFPDRNNYRSSYHNCVEAFSGGNSITEDPKSRALLISALGSTMI